MPTRVHRIRRRRRRSVTSRLRGWLEAHVWSSFKLTRTASRAMSTKERWQVLVFAVALVAATLTAFTFILLENPSHEVDPAEEQ